MPRSRQPSSPRSSAGSVTSNRSAIRSPSWRCASDDRALYEAALRHENETDAPFPRELAAFWSIANGITVDGDPLLYPVSGWELDQDEQLCIGCGGYVQGSLVFEDPPGLDDLMTAAVVDRDDYGEERARYADFAAFVDALLGT